MLSKNFMQHCKQTPGWGISSSCGWCCQVISACPTELPDESNEACDITVDSMNGKNVCI